MKPRTELLLCSGFFFLGGLLLYPIVQSDEVLAPISILLGLLGGAGLLISYFSAVRRLLFEESCKNPNSDHHKEDSHWKDDDTITFLQVNRGSPPLVRERLVGQ